MAQQIKQLLNHFLARQNAENWQLYLMQHWRTIVGDLHIRMNIENISGDTLIIGVYDPHWMQELYLLSSVLRETINDSLEQAYVKRIRFVLAKRRDGKAELAVKKVAQKVIIKNKIITDRQYTALSAVKDEKLQHILQDFLQYCRR